MTDDELWPRDIPPGCIPDRMAEDLQELRRLSLEQPPGLNAMGDLIYARRASNSLSDRDMARAARLTEAGFAALVEEWDAAEQQCAENRTAEHLSRHSLR